MRILVYLPVDGLHGIETGQHEGLLQWGEQLLNFLVHLVQIACHVGSLYVLVCCSALPVECARTAGDSARHVQGDERQAGRARAGVELELLFRVLVAQRLGQGIGQLIGIELADAVAGALKEPDVALAQGEQEEAVLTAEQLQEGFHVEAGADDGERLKVQRQAVVAHRSVAHENGQSVALSFPEQIVAPQILGWLEQLLDLTLVQPALLELVLCLLETVLEPDRILADVATAPVGGQIGGDAEAARLLYQVFQVVTA